MSVMSGVFRGSAAFVLSAAMAASAPAPAVASGKQQSAGAAAPCDYDRPMEYISLKEHGTKVKYRAAEGEKVTRAERRDQEHLYERLIREGHIAVVEGSAYEMNNGGCGAPSFTFRVKKQVVRELENNEDLNAGIIIDFNGRADNTDMPVLWGDIDMDSREYQVDGEVYYSFGMNRPLEQKTLEQIKKANGVVLAAG